MFVIAFDADKTLLKADGRPARPAVLAGERKLIERLLSIDDVSSAEWSIDAGKGLDDLLTAHGTYRLVDRYVPPSPRPRVPRPGSSPGAVEAGAGFDEVQTETAERIGRRFAPGYASTIALIAPPPGTSKTGSSLRALEGTSRKAAFGVARHAQADELVARSQDESCQCGQRRGGCPKHQFILNHDEGRNAENCRNYEVVVAAREAGYGERVGLGVCGTQAKPICEYFFECRYQGQFERPGSHVAPAEIVTQRPTFTEEMTVVIFDDLDSGRLVARRKISDSTLKHARTSPGGRALLPLLDTLERALAQATNEGVYHQAAYALLDDAARARGSTLEAVLTATPPALKLTPPPTVEGYRAAVPGQLIDLVQLLHEEYAWVRDGGPITSGLRLSANGIDTARLLAPTVRDDGRTSLKGKAVLVLSSTPDPILRQWIGTLGLEVLNEYRPRIGLPAKVRVIQDVGGFYGKTTTQAHGARDLIRRASAYFSELRPARPAVITHKHLQAEVAAGLGLPVERVLYFGNTRGSNALRDADCLLILGTPGMDPAVAYWLACGAYRGEAPPPSRRMEMRYQRYGGWTDQFGRGREIEVVSFVDERVAEIHESSRRDELFQAIYRCRPFDSGAPGDERNALSVVLLSALPVAGLRVDDLRFSGNAARAEEATGRLDEALSGLTSASARVTGKTLGRAASTSKGRALAYERAISAERTPTCIDPLIQVGVSAAETAVSGDSEPDQAAVVQTSEPRPCSCAPCPANRGDKCNCGLYWFEPPTGLLRTPHCGRHDAQKARATP